MVVAVTYSNPAIIEVIVQVVVKGDGTSTLMLVRIIDHAHGHRTLHLLLRLWLHWVG